MTSPRPTDSPNSLTSQIPNTLAHSSLTSPMNLATSSLIPRHAAPVLLAPQPLVQPPLTPLVSTTTTCQNPVPARNTSAFRLQAKNIFLTWPQNVATKEATSEKIIAIWGDQVSWFVVCEEEHKSGDPHLHAIIAFVRKMFIKGKKGMEQLDSITGKHGNYQAVRSLKQTVTYVTKDGQYLSHNIDVPLFVSAAATKKSTTIATMLLENKTLEEVCEEDPGYFMIHKRKIEDFQVWVERKKAKTLLQTWLPLDLNAYEDADLQIATWLNENIGVDRDFKAKQLYLYGPPDIGKTTLIMNLSKFLRIYYIPVDEVYCCHYEDNDWDLAVLDEFKGQKPITWLNKWLEGAHMLLTRKSISSVTKKKNIPTIILSNHSLQTCYTKALDDCPHRLDPLYSRLEILMLADPINVLFEPK